MAGVEVRHRRSAASAERLERSDWPEAEVTAEQLYVAVDGVMVHETDGYHQAKTVTCCWAPPDGQREARHTVRFETAAVFATLVWSLACRCGLNSAKEIILLGDGAKCNRDHIAPPVEGVTCIVDGYHAMEHVRDCGAGCTAKARRRRPPGSKAWKRCYGTAVCGRCCVGCEPNRSRPDLRPGGRRCRSRSPAWATRMTAWPTTGSGHGV